MSSNPALNSDFLNYLVSFSAKEEANSAATSIPSLSELSKELGVSVASLREQVEVAEAFGLVEVRPHTGMRRLPYSFFPAVYQSLSYAIQLDRSYFDAFSELRNQIEEAFWDKAVRLLTSIDHQALRSLIDQAWEKLHGDPVQVPHPEHRALHLLIYSRLENPFVQGVLEAYWEAYEKAGLTVYADYNYHQGIWNYHQKMVEAICSGDFDAGYRALVDHKLLLYKRPAG
jgi:DNA-binding FadR family transcriptional regulator